MKPKHYSGKAIAGDKIKTEKIMGYKS